MKHFRPILLTSLLLSVAVCAGGATIATPASPPSPASARTIDTRSADEFFGNTRIHTFELSIGADAFANMAASHEINRRRQASTTEGGEARVPAQLRFDGVDWGRVMIRYKGNSSYRGAPSELKVSLKVDFNRADKQRRFHGMNQINLNNNAFDPSGMRETLAYDVFRTAGVPAPRTAFARVFVTVPGRYDHQYAGLFTAVEEVDQSFFVERWRQKTGVLAKPENLFGMPAFGDDWKNYVRPYSLRITSRPDDAARLAAFIQFLNHSTNEDFAKHIDEYLDVDEFLHFLAAQVLIVNADSPLAMDHNYWLTVHPVTHKVMWLPWDMNEAFGTFRGGDAQLSIHRPSAPGRFPLADRLLAIPAVVARYDTIMRELLASNVTLARLEPAMRDMAKVIREAVTQDATMSASAFDSNFQTDAAVFSGSGFFWGHSGPPLRPFLAERIKNVNQELAASETR